jgi:hypothetical protein
MSCACTDFFIRIGHPALLGAAPCRCSAPSLEQAAFLERYNQPELFLADVKNLDLQQIIWKSGNRAVFTRPDGVEVRIWKHGIG